MREVTRIEYFDPCDVCNKDIHVGKGKKAGTCYDCQTELAMKKAKQALDFMIGAKVVEIMPTDWGHCTDAENISLLQIETTDGRIIEFSAGGWDERYIEWEIT